MLNFHKSTIFWIIQVRIALFLSGDINTWRHLYLDLMFSVRYEVFETIDRLFYIFRSQNDVLLVLYLFVWWCAKAMSLVFILDVHRHSDLLSERFKNKRWMLCILYNVKIFPMATCHWNHAVINNPATDDSVDCCLHILTYQQFNSLHVLI
jgi:hypothetical protein